MLAETPALPPRLLHSNPTGCGRPQQLHVAGKMIKQGPRLVPANHLPCGKCTLGCPVLDGLLGGGLPCGSLTELVGERA